MNTESYLNYFGGIGMIIAYWANGKCGVIADYYNNNILYYVEARKSTELNCLELVYNDDEVSAMCPPVAAGIVAWWLIRHNTMTAAEVYESYYQACLNMYRSKREKDADSWNANYESEFLGDIHLASEERRIELCEPIYEYISESDKEQIQRVIDNYKDFIKCKIKSNKKISSKSEPTSIEFIILKHLNDGKDHEDIPEGIEKNVYDAYVDVMKGNGLVYAAIESGGNVISAKITSKGIVALKNYEMGKRETSQKAGGNEEFTPEEKLVLKFLSDGKVHLDKLEIEDYDDICQYLQKRNFVILGKTEESVKLAYEGKRYCTLHKEELNNLQLPQINNNIKEKSQPSQAENKAEGCDNIPQDCKSAVDLVFIPEFKIENKVFHTRMQIQKACQLINLSSNSEIAMLMTVCKEVGAVHPNAKYISFVRAMIGLGLIQYKDNKTIDTIASGISKKKSGYTRNGKTYPPLDKYHNKWNTRDLPLGQKLYEALTSNYPKTV